MFSCLKGQREQNLSEQQQLRSQISQLEQNPTNSENQAELAAKKQKLAELETKAKELTKSLPLTTQISLLEREIKALSDKSTKTKAEESILESKKKELEELLKKQNSSTGKTDKSDKIGLYIGCGVVVVALVGVMLVWMKRGKKDKSK